MVSRLSRCESTPIGFVTFNDVPPRNDTLKYERLGPMVLANHQRYCERHGYGFDDSYPGSNSRPACWSKIPAILRAFERHEWVLWADSDALVVEPERRLEEFCDTDANLVVQCPRAYFAHIGWNVKRALAMMPVNTGVFLIRNSRWSKDLLRRAYAQEHLVSVEETWNGIGDQEAIIGALKSRPEDLKRIRYVEGLQSHPRLHKPGNLFVHLFGNHAQHRVPLAVCERVLQKWEAAIANDRPLPGDLARLHWCSIQNKTPNATVDRGGPERFLYTIDDIDGAT